MLCTKCWRGCRPRGSTPGRRNMDRSHQWVSASHTHTIPSGLEIRMKTSLQRPQRCYSNFIWPVVKLHLKQLHLSLCRVPKRLKSAVLCMCHCAVWPWRALRRQEGLSDWEDVWLSSRSFLQLLPAEVLMSQMISWSVLYCASFQNKKKTKLYNIKELMNKSFI